MATKALTLDALKASNKPKLEKVELESGFVFVKKWTVGEHDEVMSVMRKVHEAYANGTTEQQAEVEVECRYTLLLKTVCDENGNPFFTTETIDQCPTLPAEEVSKMLDASAKFNGLGSNEVPTDPN